MSDATAMLAAAEAVLVAAGFAPRAGSRDGWPHLHVPLTGAHEALVSVAGGSVPGFSAELMRRETAGWTSMDRFHHPSAKEIAATVRDWNLWEQTWSYTPAIPTARHRLHRAQRLAASKLAADVPVRVDIDPVAAALLDHSQAAALDAALAQLHPAALAWHFPRDKAGGRPANRLRVLLLECAAPRHSAQKGLHLVADGPVPRTEPVITVRLAEMAGRSAVHRWESVPQRWRSGPGTVDRLWGLDRGTTPGKAAQVTDLLLAGRIQEALAACGVRTDPGATRLLAGLPESYEMREWTDKWVTAAVTLLIEAAPWRFAGVVPVGQRRRRIGNLGGYNPNRRPGLFLHEDADGPVVTFDANATPLVVPRVEWERDPDQDLERLGLIRRDQIPRRPA